MLDILQNTKHMWQFSKKKTINNKYLFQFIDEIIVLAIIFWLQYKHPTKLRVLQTYINFGQICNECSSRCSSILLLLDCPTNKMCTAKFGHGSSVVVVYGVTLPFTWKWMQFLQCNFTYERLHFFSFMKIADNLIPRVFVQRGVYFSIKM